MRSGLGRGLMLPRVHRVRSRGKIYKFHRVTRAPLPADIPEDHPDFVTAWLAQEQKPTQRPAGAPQGTVAHGCEAYLRSGGYAALRPAYRAVIRRHVDAIRGRGGAARMADLMPRHVAMDLDPLTPAVASSRLKAWHKLAEFWQASGMTAHNITSGIKRKAMPKTGGHQPWGQGDVDAFRARWPIGSEQRTALELLQWTGARCSDACRIGPQMVERDGVLRFVQAKTGNEALVPWMCPAFGLDAERADLMACVAQVRDLVFLRTAYGRARTVKGLSQWFADAARQAGLQGKTAHGLRKYRMNRLAEAGLSVTLMQTWCGHVTLDEVQEYTARANRRGAISGALGENVLQARK